MRKIKVEWLAAVLVILIIGLVLSLILMSSLNPNSHEAKIDLPNSADIMEVAKTQNKPREPYDTLLPAVISRSNVQNVLKTLNRPETYFTLTQSAVYLDGASRTVITERWVTPGRQVVRKNDDAEDRALYILSQNGSEYVWYEDDPSAEVYPEGEFSGDAAAGTPTYETLLTVSPDSIINASYRDYGGEPCIYTETFDTRLFYTQRYYISIASGLLFRAETYSQGEMVYSYDLMEYSPDVSAGEAITPP